MGAASVEAAKELHVRGRALASAEPQWGPLPLKRQSDAAEPVGERGEVAAMGAASVEAAKVNDGSASS